MDIRSLAVADTARLHLRGPDDKLLYEGADSSRPVVVVVYGPGSKQHAQAQAAQSNRLLALLQRHGKKIEQTVDQKAEEAAEFLADCTQGFEHLSYDALSGRDLALAVYRDRRIGFVADQVAKFLGDWGNFTNGSATN